MTMQKKSILYVEDELELAVEVIEGLEEAGYRVIHSKTSQDALNKAANEKFYCLVFDIHLAVGTGDEVISKIRNNRIHVNNITPCVVVSSHLNKELVVKLADLIQGALVKPYLIDHLLDKIKEAVRKRV